MGYKCQLFFVLQATYRELKSVSCFSSYYRCSVERASASARTHTHTHTRTHTHTHTHTQETDITMSLVEGTAVFECHGSVCV